MKICLVYPYNDILTDETPHVGGMDVLLDNMMFQLDRKGHEVYMMTYGSSKDIEIKKRGGNSYIYKFPAFDKIPFPFPILKDFGLKLIRTMNKIDPDVIHIHNVVSAFAIATAFGKINNHKPIILSLHSLDKSYGNSLLDFLIRVYYLSFGKLIFSKSDIIVAPSKLNKFTVEPDEIIPHGVSDEYHPIGSDEKKAIRSETLGVNRIDKFIILYIGRLISVKGIENLCNIMKYTLERNKNLLFVIRGEGPDINKIEALKREYGDNIIIIGRSKSVVKLYQMADILIFPSLSDWAPLAVNEAVASGIPVVGSDLPGITKHVQNGFNGFLFDPQNWRGMAEQCLRLGEDKRLRDIISKNSLDASSRKSQSWETYVDSYIKLYRNVLKESQSIR